MSETTEPKNVMKPGDVSWNELTVPDPAAAIAFYQEMFGWETEKFTAVEHDYTMFKQGGQFFGGVMATPKPGARTMWTNYVIVEEVDTKVAQATSLGAQVCLAPTDIPQVGRIAIIADPQGAIIGLHQPPKS